MEKTPNSREPGNANSREYQLLLDSQPDRIIERRTGDRILVENFFVYVIFKNVMLFSLPRQVNRNLMLHFSGIDVFI